MQLEKKEIRIDDLKTKKKTDKPTEDNCLLCRYGISLRYGKIEMRERNAFLLLNQTENKTRNVLFGIIEQSYGRVDNVELARQLHLYTKGRPGKPIRMAVALEHLRIGHKPDVFFLQRNFKRWEKIRDSVSNR